MNKQPCHGMPKIGAKRSNQIRDIIKIIPDDELGKMRIKRIQKAERIFIEKRKGQIVGVVYVNLRFGFLPNITWITKEGFRNRGIATKLVKQAQEHYRILTAKTRNPVSARVARKTNFRRVYKNYWVSWWL